jgi:hypothetical protein
MNNQFVTSQPKAADLGPVSPAKPGKMIFGLRSFFSAVGNHPTVGGAT